jgi:hypothetical protein
LSEAERKAERDHETIQRMMEQEAWRRIDKEDREEIEHVIRLPDDEEFLNLIGQLDTEPRCTHSRAGDGVHVCPDCGQQLD